jgi:hypothetical protein
VEPSPNYVRPLTFSSSPVGTPESESESARCAVFRPFTLRLREEGVDPRARGLCFGLPVRARRAEARERLPSYREPARFYTCRPPRRKTVRFASPARTVSPSVHPCPASARLRTSSWLAPSLHQQVLRPPGEEDARCVQPTSATQSNCVHPHLVCSQLALATFAAGRPAETKAPRTTTGGPDVSRRPKNASADRHAARASNSIASRPGERTWASSSHGAAAIEPLTPLSRPSCFPRSSRLREVYRRSRRPPRPPPSPTRESLRRILIRDAFHRQGLFIGFGGRYSPEPATTSPLLAMVRPLSDDLSPP